MREKFIVLSFLVLLFSCKTSKNIQVDSKSKEEVKESLLTSSEVNKTVTDRSSILLNYTTVGEMKNFRIYPSGAFKLSDLGHFEGEADSVFIEQFTFSNELSQSTNLVIDAEEITKDSTASFSQSLLEDEIKIHSKSKSKVMVSSFVGLFATIIIVIAIVLYLKRKFYLI